MVCCMLLLVSCLLLFAVSFRLLCLVCCSLFVVRDLVSVVFSLLFWFFVVFRLLFFCFSFNAWCVLVSLVVCCFLCVAFSCLFFVAGLLFVICCLWLVAVCFSFVVFCSVFGLLLYVRSVFVVCFVFLLFRLLLFVF